MNGNDENEADPGLGDPGPCAVCGEPQTPHADGSGFWCPMCTLRAEEAAAELQEGNPWDKPAACLGCPLWTEPGPVWGFGPETRNSMVYVAEKPGDKETESSAQSPHTQRFFSELYSARRENRAKRLTPPLDDPRDTANRFRPFSGESGRMFTNMLSNAGVLRRDFYITNVVKCVPPGNSIPPRAAIEKCRPFLRAEIEELDPNVIVALGEIALNELTEKKGISLARGVVAEGRGVAAGRKVFPTWNPAYIARAQYNWPFEVHDLARAATQASFPEIRRVPYDIVRHAVYAEYGATVLADIRARGKTAFDFETTGLSAHRDSIRMLGITTGPDKAYVFDWSPGPRSLLQAVLDDPAVEVIGQNILYFDLPFAEEKGIRVDYSKNIFDTMVAFHLCNASYGQTPIHEQNAGTYRQKGMDKDLAMIASCHTDMEYWKSRASYKEDLHEVCGKDCIATDRSATSEASGLQDELRAYDMTDLYYKHVLPVHPILHRMTKRGMKIDEDAGIRWSVYYEQAANELETLIKEGLGDPGLNLNSPMQLSALLYDKLKLPEQLRKNKQTGLFRRSADADALETLAKDFPQNAILTTIVEMRNFRKLKSTFIDPGVRYGRLHPKFSVSKTANGRFNSYGPNAQNAPEVTRDIWIPDSKEHVLLCGDWSQIEWRTAMVLSGDPVGLKLLASGVDNHRAIAAEAFGKQLSEITDELRHAAKFIVYGLSYGRGVQSIADADNLDYGFVASFVDRFFQRFAHFAAWRERNIEFVKKNRFLANAWKRRRWWYTWQITEIHNFPPSSTAADMMYDTMIMLDAQLPKGAEIRLTVHDELVLNVAKDVAKETFVCMRDVMQSKWPRITEYSADEANVKKFYPDGWHCPVDLHAGLNWKMAKSKDPTDKKKRAELEAYLGLDKL